MIMVARVVIAIVVVEAVQVAVVVSDERADVKKKKVQQPIFFCELKEEFF